MRYYADGMRVSCADESIRQSASRLVIPSVDLDILCGLNF